MNSRKANFIVLLIVGVFVIFRLIYPPASDDTLGNNILNIAIEVLGGVLLYGIIYILSNLNRLWLFLVTKTWYYNKEIRFSISYLYRIKVDDKYLLIKSRTRDYFQPVGGVFKTLPGSEKVFEKLKVRPDRIFQTEKRIAKGDLRVFVKGVNALDFIDWFDSKEDREVSPWREFVEELITPGFLPWNEFRYIDYKFKKTIQTPIIKLDSGEKGIFIYEVYDLIPNDQQVNILNKLKEKGNQEELIWATENLIKRLGHSEDAKGYVFEISQHTKWASELKWS